MKHREVSTWLTFRWNSNESNDGSKESAQDTNYSKNAIRILVQRLTETIDIPTRDGGKRVMRTRSRLRNESSIRAEMIRCAGAGVSRKTVGLRTRLRTSQFPATCHSGQMVDASEHGSRSRQRRGSMRASQRSALIYFGIHHAGRQILHHTFASRNVSTLHPSDRVAVDFCGSRKLGRGLHRRPSAR